jgi:hypothetical protein
MEHNDIIKWEAFEYKHTHKQIDWYIALGIIATAASAATFMLGNILFGIFIILGAFTLAMYSKRKPGMMHMEIGTRGILFNNRVYPYNSLKSFWVKDSEEEPKIIIQSNKMFMPYIIIPLGNTDPEKVREFLFEYIEEEEHCEPLSHKLMEYLGF